MVATKEFQSARMKAPMMEPLSVEMKAPRWVQQTEYLTAPL